LFSDFFNFQKKKFKIFFKNYFLNYVVCHVAKVDSQQLPHGVQHAKSAGMWGQGPFSNKKVFVGM